MSKISIKNINVYFHDTNIKKSTVKLEIKNQLCKNKTPFLIKLNVYTYLGPFGNIAL